MIDPEGNPLVSSAKPSISPMTLLDADWMGTTDLSQNTRDVYYYSLKRLIMGVDLGEPGGDTSVVTILGGHKKRLGTIVLTSGPVKLNRTGE